MNSNTYVTIGCLIKSNGKSLSLLWKINKYFFINLPFIFINFLHQTWQTSRVVYNERRKQHTEETFLMRFLRAQYPE